MERRTVEQNSPKRVRRDCPEVGRCSSLRRYELILRDGEVELWVYGQSWIVTDIEVDRLDTIIGLWLGRGI